MSSVRFALWVYLEKYGCWYPYKHYSSLAYAKKVINEHFPDVQAEVRRLPYPFCPDEDIKVVFSQKGGGV